MTTQNLNKVLDFLTSQNECHDCLFYRTRSVKLRDVVCKPHLPKRKCSNHKKKSPTMSTPKVSNPNHYYMVMLFFQKGSIDPHIDPEEYEVWVNTRNLTFTKAFEALEAYANIKCPASQLIEADSQEELEAKRDQMIRNYQDEAWLQTNLYPFI